MICKPVATNVDKCGLSTSGSGTNKTCTTMHKSLTCINITTLVTRINARVTPPLWTRPHVHIPSTRHPPVAANQQAGAA